MNTFGSDAGTTVILHENPWFRVCDRQGYWTVEPKALQVAVLPVVGRDVVLVEVRRPVVGRVLLELPAGGAECGEAPAAAARRELAEETGIWIESLDRFRSLPALTITPDRSPQWPGLFRVEVTEDEYRARRPHDLEVEGVRRLDPATLCDLVRNGGIVTCLALAVLFREHLETIASAGARA